MQDKKALVETFWATESELHEIWQAEGKRPFEQWLSLCLKVPPDFGKFLHIAIENYDFAIYSNFCFLNNFLLKSQNNVSLVLGSLLRSVVYDSAFNSNFPFLVTFGILSPNCVINANYGFKRFA